MDAPPSSFINSRERVHGLPPFRGGSVRGLEYGVRGSFHEGSWRPINHVVCGHALNDFLRIFDVRRNSDCDSGDGSTARSVESVVGSFASG